MKKNIVILCWLFIHHAGAGVLQKILSNFSATAQNIQFVFEDSTVTYKAFIYNDDLIVDFYSVTGSQIQGEIKLKTGKMKGYVDKINITTVPGRLRVLIAGAAKYKYQLRHQDKDNVIIVSLDKQVGKMPISSRQIGIINPLHKTLDSAFTISIDSIKFKRDDNGGGIIEVSYSGDGTLDISRERMGSNLIIQLHNVSYAYELIKRLDVTDFATPIKYVDTLPQKNNLKIILLNRNSWDYAFYQFPNKLIINIRNFAGNNPDSSELINLHGNNYPDHVSFNFQNIEIRALLQLLADFSGYNILVSDNVRGNVSIKLNNVPWDQALKTILITKGLDMKREGNIMRIAPAAELATMSKQQQDSQALFEAAEPLDTLTIRLKYAQAANIHALILKPLNSNDSPNVAGATTIAAGSQIMQLLSPRGSIITDNRTNTIIVNDTPSRLKEIKGLIDKIDIPVKQVFIEARIVEANSYFERDLGTRLLLAGVVANTTFANTLSNGSIIKQQGIAAIDGADAATYINQDFKIHSGGSLAAIFAPNSNSLIGLEIDALELQNQGRTISNPKIMTANYQTANIQQGIQIPYQQASGIGNTNVAFVNATLSLQVTPQITEDGYILLNVNIKKDTPNTSLVVQGTPSINTNSVVTQVRIKDGATILVGGIYIDDQKKTVQQIPLLGDIPYLGRLFKAQTTESSKKELLIFMTPRVIANNLDNDD